MSPTEPPLLTADQYQHLKEIGVLGSIELIDGRVVCRAHDLVFSPQQAREAARHGVHVPSAVDAILADEARSSAPPPASATRPTACPPGRCWGLARTTSSARPSAPSPAACPCRTSSI